ncbi:hypothetical protein FOG50_03052 [Hanseniaspora uvarum]|nr:hypothetical protein FOG50_03052 [Hanseniaspora uvarum]
MVYTDIFTPLVPADIELASELIKKHPNNVKDLVQFVQIDKLNPPRKQSTKLVDELRAGKTEGLPVIDPKVYVLYYKNNEMPLFKSIVNLKTKTIEITTQEEGLGPMQGEFIEKLDAKVFSIPQVKENIERLNLKNKKFNHPTLGELGYNVISETWMYGNRGEPEDHLKPKAQIYFFIKLDHLESNHYALPLPFTVIVDYFTCEYIDMVYLPMDGDDSTPITPDRLNDWVIPDDIHKFEYYPEVRIDYEPELNLKPLSISQPEGVSFNVTNDNKVEWQGWEFYVQTNVREGFSLNNIYFKGRPLIWKYCLNDMIVPYSAKPMSTKPGEKHKNALASKMAFDVSEIGFGNVTFPLGSGCCLGYIKYFDACKTDIEGKPVVVKNQVCMHEVDNGVQCLHKNYRTENNKLVLRRRELILQTVATVANYEYIIQFILDQNGSITTEVRATGILSTTAIEPNTKTDHSTVVAPGVNAQYHQHLFSFRLDPRFDGDLNSVCYDDFVPLEDNEEDWLVGFKSKRTWLEKSGHIEQSPFTNRTYKFINENVINPVSMTPVGYKVEIPAHQLIMAGPNSQNIKRAKFATKQFWAYHAGDDRNYIAGELTNQSKEDTGLAKWLEEDAKADKSIRNTELSCNITLGLSHAPSTEQFPVMSMDKVEFSIIPVCFFWKNPALDLPIATAETTKIVCYEDIVAGKQSSCCKK